MNDITIKPGDTIYVVLDPGPESVLADVLLRTTLDGLNQLYRGGPAVCLTLHMDEQAARADAEARLRSRDGVGGAA